VDTLITIPLFPNAPQPDGAAIAQAGCLCPSVIKLYHECRLLTEMHKMTVHLMAS
jgi:hypothetical protein